MDAGEVVETGTHEELSAKRGYYYNLVRNQLELGG
jgi:ATP-binding cassette subfamily B protein